MVPLRVIALQFALAFLSISVITSRPVAAAPPAPLEGFVEVNGVRLQYLEWGGKGPALILIHDVGQNAHKFDDLAPAFADRFRVIAYSRRGAAGSQASVPYDAATLTQDLLGLMDALGIASANLASHSFGGLEMTQLAAEHPERVNRIVYLDAAYDFTDPDFPLARTALPAWVFARPTSAMTSFDAYRSYEEKNWYGELDDMTRIDAYLHQNVVIQSDGSLKDRPPPGTNDAIFSTLATGKRDYSRVRCPVLAIYAEYVLAIHSTDARRRNDALVWEQKYWRPFQAKSIELMRRELIDVEISHIGGRQVSFFLTNRREVVDIMRRFLTRPERSGVQRGADSMPAPGTFNSDRVAAK